MDLNNFTFTCRVTQAPVLNTVGQNATPLLKIQVAVNSGFGQNQKTLFIEIAVWGKQANTLQPYISVGKQLAVSGAIEIQEWISKKDGSKQIKIAVNAKEVVLLGGGAQDSDGDDWDKDSAEDAESSPI